RTATGVRGFCLGGLKCNVIKQPLSKRAKQHQGRDVRVLLRAIRPLNYRPPVQTKTTFSRLLAAPGNRQGIDDEAHIMGPHRLAWGDPPTRRDFASDPSFPVEKHEVLPPSIYSVFPPVDLHRPISVASIRHTDLHVLRAGPHLPPGATPKSHTESNALDNRCIDAKKPVALRQIRRSAGVALLQKTKKGGSRSVVKYKRATIGPRKTCGARSREDLCISLTSKKDRSSQC
ncbi:hypothetical protein BJY52DRAFT_1227855, partial [Lactarius psammicola]